MDIIHHLVKSHKISVVMIVHDLNLAARYADRVVMLYEGKIHAEGNSSDVLNAENISYVYGINAIIEHKHGAVSVIPVSRTSNHQRKEKVVV